MNESQERREELLRMSRQKWRKGSIPAVHPRYQHVYRGLYGEHSSEENVIEDTINMFVSSQDKIVRKLTVCIRPKDYLDDRIDLKRVGKYIDYKCEFR